MKEHITYRQAFLFVLFSILISGCTISHDYGPYKGRVLDLETGGPIEGAVVFLRFYTQFQLSPGGPVAKYADAIEVVTNQNGEFSIPTHKVEAFRILHGWEPECTVVIFKPGYGAFPKHKKTKPRFKPSYSIPEGQYIVVWLPKLRDRGERKKNLANIPYVEAPHKKFNNLKKLEELETNFIYGEN